MAVGSSPIVTARHYTKAQMESAGYSFQMVRHPEVFLNLDAKEMGAGGIDSWSPTRTPWPPTGSIALRNTVSLPHHSLDAATDSPPEPAKVLN